jgi:OOP family OmpA-OmpF porin
LIQQGISEERIITSGFGENEPSGNNETAEGRTENRRVQFKAKL